MPGPGGGCVQTLPQMATVADGTHPTGMHSCLSYKNCQSEFVSIRL